MLCIIHGAFDSHDFMVKEKLEKILQIRILKFFHCIHEYFIRIEYGTMMRHPQSIVDDCTHEQSLAV